MFYGIPEIKIFVTILYFSIYFVLYVIKKLSSDKLHCMSENKSVVPSQIHFHSRDWTSLHKFITPDVLPPEYGGQKREVDFTKSQQYLYDNEEKLMGKTYIKPHTILRTLVQRCITSRTVQFP